MLGDTFRVKRIYFQKKIRHVGMWRLKWFAFKLRVCKSFECSYALVHVNGIANRIRDEMCI